MVLKRQLQLTDAQMIRIHRRSDFAGITRQHIFVSHDQQLRVFGALALVPAFETGGLVDVLRHAGVVVGEQRVFIGNDVPPPGLGFQFVEQFQQLAIGGKRLGPAVHLPAHQAFANEQLPCGRRVDRPEMHRAPRHHDHAVQGDLLEGHHLAALLLPVRLRVVGLDQVLGQRLDPVRLDLRHHAGEQLGGFDQFRRHDPVGLLAPDNAGRVHPESPLSGTEEVALLGLVPDLAEQAGQDRLMHGRVTFGLLRSLVGFGLLGQLDVNLLVLGQG